MLLPVTITVSPETEAPPQGLSLSGLRQSVSPLAADKHMIERSPTFSLSRKAEQTSTLSPTTLTAASTCHLSLPCCQRRVGLARGSWSSLGGMAKQGSFFFSISYLSCSSFQRTARTFWTWAKSIGLPSSET